MLCSATGPRNAIAEIEMTNSNDRPDTPGSLPPEPVEDRPNVGTVKPGQYPDRQEGSVADADKENERLNPGDSRPPPVDRPGAGRPDPTER